MANDSFLTIITGLGKNCSTGGVAKDSTLHGHLHHQGALAAHFMVVFVAGLTLYGLEQSYLLFQMHKTSHGAEPQMKAN